MRVRVNGEPAQVCEKRGALVCVMFSDGYAEWHHKDEVKPVNVVRKFREEV